MGMIMDTLVMMQRMNCSKQSTPWLAAVGIQSIKVSSCINEAKGIDGNMKINGHHGNSRRRYLAVDTLGLPWAIHVGTTDHHDGEAGLEPLHQMDSQNMDMVKVIRGGAAYGGVSEDDKVIYR